MLKLILGWCNTKHKKCVKQTKPAVLGKAVYCCFFCQDGEAKSKLATVDWKQMDMAGRRGNPGTRTTQGYSEI